MAILNTPLAIFSEASIFFPTITGRVSLEDQEIHLYLQLQEGSPEILFRTSVLKKDFLEELSAFFTATKLGLHTKKSIDPTRYSVKGRRLSDWKSFRRVMFEKNGRFILNEIIRAFENDSLETLHDLGLAPQQIEEHFDAEDIKYFQEFYQALDKVPPGSRQSLFAKFQQLYPNISTHLLTEEHKKQIAAYNRQRDIAPYQRILMKLNEMVVAQEAATETLARTLAAPSDANTLFLFIGPTGVGKTEMAFSVSKIKDNGRILSISMDSYPKESVGRRLFGAPLGCFPLSTDMPYLAQALNAQCHPTITSETESETCFSINDAVIVFDELEKAPPDIQLALLSFFFDTGSLVYTKKVTESSVRNVTLQYTFKRCVIIVTSNRFQKQIREASLQIIPEETLQQRSDRLEASFLQLNRTVPIPPVFPEEALCRMKIITFGPIPKGLAYKTIIRTHFKQFCDQLKKDSSFYDISTENEQDFLSAIQERVYEDGTDLRKFKRDLFPRFQQIILENYEKWGNPNEVKIIFTLQGNNPVIRVFHVVKKHNHILELETLNLF